MIKIFNSTDKSFSSNGDIVINPLKAVVHKEDNGDYYLDFEAGIEYADYLVGGNIIVAPTPQGEQAFRISNPQKTQRKITLKAYHVYYDTHNYLIQDSYVVDKNCNAALDWLNSATDTTSPFTTLSDVETVDSYRCVRTSLNEAIGVILERWGGHLVRDNWNIQIRKTIGQDNGVTVRYAKNIKEITYTENWDSVVTKLLPTGTDGIMLNALDESEDPYLYAGITYPIPYTKTVAFEQTISEEDYQDADGNTNETAYKTALIDDLRVQAQQYLDEHSVPEINYTLKANVEKITDIGDTIEVIDERLGIDLFTNLIAFDYDYILGKYTSLEFGNYKEKKLSNLVNNITSSVTEQVTINTNNAVSGLQSDLQAAQNKINGVLGNSYVIYNGDDIIIVDTLPKESARNVIKINNAGIAFSQTGINGMFTSAWTIDGTLNMEAINVINLTADLIKGGTLKLGSNLDEYGTLEIYDEANDIIGVFDKNGLKLYGQDGSYVLMNHDVGFAGYDRLGNILFYVAKDEFHMKKSVVEQEITLCNKVRFIPITLTDSNNNIVNDGIGLVSVAGV